MANLSNLWALSLSGQYSPEDVEARQAARVALFNRVAPKPNWKMPIEDQWVPAADYAELDNAVIHFTGAGLEIIKASGDQVLVRSPGYYATIGS